MESLSPELFHTVITYLDTLDLIRSLQVNQMWFIVAYLQYLIQKKQGKQIITSPVHINMIHKLSPITFTYIRFPKDAYFLQSVRKYYLRSIPGIAGLSLLEQLECTPQTIHHVFNYFLSKLIIVVEDYFDGDALWKLWNDFNFVKTFRNVQEMKVIFTSKQLAQLYWPKPKRELLPRKLKCIKVYSENTLLDTIELIPFNSMD